MIIELFDPEEGDAWRVSIDLCEHLVVQGIDKYSESDPEYTVDGFLQYLRDQGVNAERLDQDEVPVFYF